MNTVKENIMRIKQGNKNVLNIFKSVNKGFCNREMLVKMYDVLSPEMQSQIDKHFQFLDKKYLPYLGYFGLSIAIGLTYIYITNI